MEQGWQQHLAGGLPYFHAAVVALEHAGIQPAEGSRGQWTHGAVQAQFAGVLINRRKHFPAEFRELLSRAFALRQTADSTRLRVTQTEARRLLRRSREFVTAIRSSVKDGST